MRRLLAAALGVSVAAGPADAAAVYSFVEHAGGVSGTLSGTLDLTGALQFFPLNIDAEPLLAPDVGALLSGGPPAVNWDTFEVSGPETWGPGAGAFASGSTGSAFGLLAGLLQGGPFLLLPEGGGGGALSGTMTFAGWTLASLGITPGSYVYDLPNDSVTVSFAEIPLPATLPLLVAALGLAAIPLVRRRRAG